MYAIYIMRNSRVELDEMVLSVFPNRLNTVPCCFYGNTFELPPH